MNSLIWTLLLSLLKGALPEPDINGDLDVEPRLFYRPD